MKTTLHAFKTGDFTQNALSFFETLGYNIEYQQPLSQKNYDGFKNEFTPLNETNALVSEWNYVDQLFFLTPENTTLAALQVENVVIDAYLIFGIELKKPHYSRSDLVKITRELNAAFPRPVLILFKHGDTLTLSVIKRRIHKRDESRDVLEKVTLLKDIRLEKTHRAHLDILESLAFSNLKPKPTNFVELHHAWQKVLDTKELNKKFYNELSQWYFWAIKHVTFPNPENIDPQQYHSQSLIRLLTRLLFVWFIKEKELIPAQLFDETYLDDVLKASDNSRFYRAILQNLFFATLNQTRGKREFRKDKQHMNVTNLMRYQSYFQDSDAFLTLVESVVPFMNGGLFECLDKVVPNKKGKQGGDVIAYFDGFSDRDDNVLSVPDFIFFGTQKNVDLSDELGNKNKSFEIKGLCDILKNYKFTIAENTPIEEDIALDPELLGQVFENLLASYNPETGTTARKQTGSFYTPREIVDYMVDESLLAYFESSPPLKGEAVAIAKAGGCAFDVELKAHPPRPPSKGGKQLLLRHLLSYNETQNPFDAPQTNALISAIDNLKILDPACGSGAFPMGILHKLVHCLHKLDPQNKLWKARQIEKINAIDDADFRDKTLQALEDAFENEVDYGRKLYLIENCIYGVDIQAIAIQISKLRFFISLIVDQTVRATKENFGVLPLPNLETKFVAANTLIAIDKPKAQISLFDNKEIDALENQLKTVRHRLFSAKTPTTKRKLRDDDKALREQISQLLAQNGWGNATAQQLAQWNPYDQNASADFFDSEWMFGLSDGFDIVIGNPPYVQIKQIAANDRLYFQQKFKFATGRFNLFYFFLEITKTLAKKEGVTAYIIPDRLLLNTQCFDLRNSLLTEQTIIEIDSFDESVFDSAVVDSIIIVYQNTKNERNSILALPNVNVSEIGNSKKIEIPITHFNASPNRQFDLNYNQEKSSLIEKIRCNTVALSKISETKDGIIQGKIPDVLFLKKEENPFCKKLLFGKDVNRYELTYENNWVNYQPDEMMKIELERVGEKRTGLWMRNRNIFEREKILTRQTSDKIIGTLDAEHFYYANTLHGTAITDDSYSVKYVLAVLNSKVLNYYYKETTSEGGKVFAQVKIEILRQLPIPKIPADQQQPFITLVDKILADKKAGNDTRALEREIDVLVYALYGLSDEEILIVEGK